MSDNFQEMERETDPLDISARKSEAFIADKIAEASRHQGPKATGYCLDPSCGEQLVSDIIIKAALEQGFPDGTPRWCDVHCRNSYEKHLKIRTIEGRTI